MAIRRLNAPEGKAKWGPANPQGERGYATSAFVKEALDRGARALRLGGPRKARSGKRTGSTVRGAGVAVSTFVAGSTGFDGLFVIKPDGKLYVQSGVGNLGTESVFDVHRPAAEMLGIPWEDVVVAWGDTSQHLPWTCVSGGSQTTHAMTRAAHAAASDAIAKAKEIAAPQARRQRRSRIASPAGACRAAADRSAWPRWRRWPSRWAASTTATSCPRTSTR